MQISTIIITVIIMIVIIIITEHLQSCYYFKSSSVGILYCCVCVSYYGLEVNVHENIAVLFIWICRLVVVLIEDEAFKGGKWNIS